ncbi:MAG: hypothetical protein AB1295_02910 [Candidatus Micrarchaeota archaeon]
MSFMKEGAACVMMKGRRAGTKVTVTKLVGESFAVVKDDKGKERKCAVTHLMPAAGKKR